MSTQPRVCFVCLGNICRSPTAEGVFLSLLRAEELLDAVVVDSAGTASYHSGSPADARSRSHALKRGYELPSLARQFVAADFDRFDFVLAMDAQNLRDLELLRREHGGELAHLHLGIFRDFDATARGGSSVPDPYYGGTAGFEEVIDQCERAARGLIEHLRPRLVRKP